MDSVNMLKDQCVEEGIIVGDSIYKYTSLTRIIKNMDKPHIPSIDLRVVTYNGIIDIESVIHDQDLQKYLMSYKSENDKMRVIINCLYNNLDNFINKGGSISIGLNLNVDDYESVDVNGFVTSFLNNKRANNNSIKFSALKGMSIYDGYLFNDIKGNDLRSVYGSIHDVLEDITVVKTYTIVSQVNETTIREVILHDFGVYGNILTKLDLKKG